MSFGKVAGILMIVALSAGVSLFIFWDIKGNVVNAPDKTPEPDTQTDADTIDVGSGIEIDVGEGESVGDGELPDMPIPDLTRPINMSDDVLISIAEETEKRITELSESLKQNPDSLSGWIELGLLRKSIDDFEGAKDAWEYASALRPKNSVSFVNLGDLYAYYLDDAEAAEENFLLAIENNIEKIIFPYVKTFEFYRDIVKDDDAARAIAERVMEEIPGAKDNVDILLGSLSQ